MQVPPHCSLLLGVDECYHSGSFFLWLKKFLNVHSSELWACSFTCFLTISTCDVWLSFCLTFVFEMHFHQVWHSHLMDFYIASQSCSLFPAPSSPIGIFCYLSLFPVDKTFPYTGCFNDGLHCSLSNFIAIGFNIVYPFVCAYVTLGFLGLWVSKFHQIWGICCHYLLEYFPFGSSSLSGATLILCRVDHWELSTAHMFHSCFSFKGLFSPLPTC